MKFLLGDKNLKSKLLLLVIEPPNIVLPNENAVGTAVIFDFLINKASLLPHQKRKAAMNILFTKSHLVNNLSPGEFYW